MRKTGKISADASSTQNRRRIARADYHEWPYMIYVYRKSMRLALSALNNRWVFFWYNLLLKRAIKKQGD